VPRRFFLHCRTYDNGLAKIKIHKDQRRIVRWVSIDYRSLVPANAETIKLSEDTRQTRKGRGKGALSIGVKVNRRSQKEPPGPHKAWAKFVRQILAELPWTIEDACDFLCVKQTWLKKALKGHFVRGDYRMAFQDRLTKKWDEYRDNKPGLGSLSWPSYIESENSDLAAASHLILKDEPSERRAKSIPPVFAPSRISFRGQDAKHGLLIGRDSERKALDSAWDGNASAWQRFFNLSAGNKLKLTGKPFTPRIIVFNAWAGIGKTSLVAKWAADKLAMDKHSGIERYFDWSFYNQGTRHENADRGRTKPTPADLFLKVALEFFGDGQFAASNASPWQKGERLAKLVSQNRTLLILDGLEPLQDARTGELGDDGVRALLRGLAAHNSGLCLVTTRQRLPELDIWSQTTAPEWELGRLTDKHGAALLTMLGVCGRETEKRSLSARVKGHALTLTLLGGYLKHAHHGDIRCADNVDFKKVNQSEQGGHAFRVIAAYEEWFKESNCHAELCILKMLGLFDRPATPDCLSSLRVPSIKGLTDLIASLDITDWNKAVSHLVDLNLVEEQPWEPQRIYGYTKQDAQKVWTAVKNGRPHNIGEPKLFETTQTRITSQKTIDTHPLIRAYFAEQLRVNQIAVWKTANARLFNHLCASTPYWPEGLDGLQPLYQAMTHGCRAGQHQKACDEVYHDRTLRDANETNFAYSSKKLGAISSDLAALGVFFDSTWDRPSPRFSVPDRAWLLNEVAFSLRALGRLDDACEPLQASVSLYKEKRNWRAAAITLSHLSELNLMLGEISSAIREAGQAVGFADRSKDVFERITDRTTLGNALHQSGQAEAAKKYFEEAEMIQRKKLQCELPFYSVHGYQLCDLLLAEAECIAWKKQIFPTTKNIAAGISTLSVACTNVANREKKTTQEKRSQMDLLSGALGQLMLGRVVLFRAILESDAENLSTAEKRITTSCDLLRKAGDSTRLPLGLLSRAWLRMILGQPDLTRADLDEAEEIADRGLMQLHLADVHLHRARLFRNKNELKQAHNLIQKYGYGRRKPELEDAKAAAKSW
jgi:tetratricopeptide (TPR) repeat protein